MNELEIKRLKKKIHPLDPEEKKFREDLDKAMQFYEGSFKIIEVSQVTINDVYNLLPEEILKIGCYLIQKTFILKNNYIAIGEMIGDYARLYSIMFASANPYAFIFDVKNDFGIEIYNNS